MPTPLPRCSSPDLSLADYIVSARLFNFFLVCGCIPGTAEHAFVTRMAAANPWPSPIPVYGYDDTFPVAGDLFEVGCVSWAAGSLPGKHRFSPGCLGAGRDDLLPSAQRWAGCNDGCEQPRFF